MTQSPAALGGPLSLAATRRTEFNDCESLEFLHQAGSEATEPDLQIEDGWRYFIHGWTRAIVTVFNLDISTNESFYNELCDVALAAR